MPNARLPEICLRLGILYLVIGMCVGAFMGAKEDFALRDAHAHINLLGYVSTFLIGLFLKTYPTALKSGLTRTAVYIILIAIPILLLTLALFNLGHQSLGPALGMLSFVVLGGYVLFAMAVFRATK